MNRLLRPARLTFATLAAALGTAWAQTPPQIQQLPTVLLQGRASLQQACPGANEALLQALDPMVYRLGAEGQMQVRFTLQGRQISAVQTASGLPHYARRVQRAIHALQCQASGDLAQVHVFEIDFKRG
jgi:hypothetical protein